MHKFVVYYSYVAPDGVRSGHCMLVRGFDVEDALALGKALIRETTAFQSNVEAGNSLRIDAIRRS